MNKFKVGDKVKVLASDYLSLPVGTIAPVHSLYPAGGSMVWSEKIRAALYFTDCELELADSTTSTAPDSKRVYVSTPLKPEKFKLSDIQETLLEQNAFAFIPTTVETTPAQAAAVNKRMIELSDELWVFGPIGRDCAWEVGYAQGLGIPVVFFESKENQYVIEGDWMLLCAGTTVNPKFKDR